MSSNPSNIRAWDKPLRDHSDSVMPPFLAISTRGAEDEEDIGVIYHNRRQINARKNQRSHEERRKRPGSSRLRAATSAEEPTAALSLVSTTTALPPLADPFQLTDWSDDELDQDPQPYIPGSVAEMYGVRPEGFLPSIREEDPDDIDYDSKTHDDPNATEDDDDQENQAPPDDDGPSSQATPLSASEPDVNALLSREIAADKLALARAYLNDELAAKSQPLIPSIHSGNGYDEAAFQRLERVAAARLDHAMEQLALARAEAKEYRKKMGSVHQAMVHDKKKLSEAVVRNSAHEEALAAKQRDVDEMVDMLADGNREAALLRASVHRLRKRQGGGGEEVVLNGEGVDAATQTDSAPLPGMVDRSVQTDFEAESFEGPDAAIVGLIPGLAPFPPPPQQQDR